MDGIERIKTLGSEVTNKQVLKIIKYLISRTDMNDKYLNEEKSLKQMIAFIKSEAKKQAEDGVAMIENDEVYSWAIHYWDESNENLGLVEKKIETPNKNKKVKEEEEIKEESNEVNKIEEVKTKEKWIPEGQLSLFD